MNEKYEQIQIIQRIHHENLIISLIQHKQTEKYYMAKKIELFPEDISSFKQKKSEVLSLTPQNNLLNEAGMLKQLNHPHVMKYFDIFLEEDYLVQVLQYCEYGSLFQYIEKRRLRNQGLSEKLLISWIIQILMALEYLHEKNVIHRSINIKNIYLNHQGDLKIGSFGYAKKLENTLKKANTIVGQPCSMSPQMVQGNSYDSKLDIWSLGCLIYELATFQSPFKFGNLLKLYDSIVNQNCPELPIKYSKYLSPLYKKMMKKNPTARSSASQLLQQPVFSNLMKEYLKKKKIDSLDLKRIQVKPLIVHKKRSLQIKKNKVLLEPISESRLSVKTPTKVQKPVEQKKLSSSRLKQLNCQKKSPKPFSKKPVQKVLDPKLSQNESQPEQPLQNLVQQKALTSLGQNEFLVSNIDTHQQFKIQSDYISLLYELKLKTLEQKYEPNMSKIFQRTMEFDSFKDLL